MCREELISELGMFTWAVETHSNLKTKKREELPNRYDRFMQRYLRKKGNANVTPCNKKHARGNVYVVCSTSNSSKHRKSNDLPLVLALHLGWPFQSLDDPSHCEILKASKWKCRKKKYYSQKHMTFSDTFSETCSLTRQCPRFIHTADIHGSPRSPGCLFQHGGRKRRANIPVPLQICHSWRRNFGTSCCLSPFG